MGNYYLDASALVKLYIDEPGSEWVETVVRARDANDSPANRVAFTKVGIVETAAAFARAERMGRMDSSICRSLFAALMRDSAARFTAIDLNDQLIRVAAHLTQERKLRGYDAIHLATALVLSRRIQEAQLPSLVFVSADELLCQEAAAEGLEVVNPNRINTER